ncbi:MAG: hypothetical protein JWP81_3391 [Ferruginibacter sp.]|nr:hypothetical protein [Ferruginibacter sp.]
MAKIVLFQPDPIPAKDVFYMKAIKSGMMQFIQRLSLQTKIHCLWRLEFYWILLKTQVLKIFFRINKGFINKKLMAKYQSCDKSHYVPIQPSRKGIAKMSCITGGDGRVKMLVPRTEPSAKVIAFKG